MWPAVVQMASSVAALRLSFGNSAELLLFLFFMNHLCIIANPKK